MFPRTLPESARDTLALLGRSQILKDTYMAGGSALALQLGHRRSIDFDFFTKAAFDPQEKANNLGKIAPFTIEQTTPKTLLGFFNQVRFSLFYYPYLLIDSTVNYENIRLASQADIAAMKLVAITGRGTKKDFIDLYELSRIYSLSQMLEFYDRKYQLLEKNKVHILKSLQYFGDADASEMPVLLKPVEWEQVKNFFVREVMVCWKGLDKGSNI